MQVLSYHGVLKILQECRPGDVVPFIVYRPSTEKMLSIMLKAATRTLDKHEVYELRRLADGFVFLDDVESELNEKKIATGTV